MSAEKITHYYPDAVVIFVKGFRPTEVPTADDALIVAGAGGPLEISDISVTLTVKNNPGTFSVTLIDTDMKYIYPDSPEKEISYLHQRSHGKSASYTTTKNQNRPGANYYEFDTYAKWLQFEYGTLEYVDPLLGMQRTMIYYRRDSSGEVIERWAFLADGTTVYVVDNGDAAMEQAFQNAKDGSSWSGYGKKPDGSLRPIMNCKLWKHANQDFVLKYKGVEDQGIEANSFKKGRCFISPMDRVVIFMTKRFDVETGDTLQAPRSRMTRVFTGIVNNVEQGFSGNQHKVSVSGEDVTKFMRLHVINVSPSLLMDQAINPDQSREGGNITVWANIFKGLSAPQIIQLVTVGGTANGTGETGRKIQGVSSYTLAAVGSGGKLLDYDPDLDAFVPAGSTTPKVKGKVTKTVSGEGHSSIQRMLGELFTPSAVHVMDPFSGTSIQGFRPYELALSGNFQFYQADFKTNREIAYQVADDTHFVFYADRFGHIWFHPPRFSNGWILGAKTPNIYIVKDEDIISFGFIEDDSNVYSSVYVSTEPYFNLHNAGTDLMIRGAYRDETVLLKYGQRLLVISNPLIKQVDPMALSMFAKSMLQRMLAGKYQGQITITGRAEIDPGRPVYIPCRNMIYYVETVDHSFSFGGQFTTTLHLAYGRKPWELLPEVLQFSKTDEIYLTDGILRAPTRFRQLKDESLTEMQKVTNISQISTDSPFVRTTENPGLNEPPAKAF